MQLIVTLITNPNKSPLEEREINRLFKTIEKHDGSVGEFVWLSVHEAVDVRFQASKQQNWNKIFKEAFKDYSIDIIVQPDLGPELRRKRFLISDMDSTIIQQECIDELADVMGLKEQVSAITERAMNGELDFAQSLTERVALLKGLKASDLQAVFDSKIKLMPGAKTLLATMKKSGAHCVLVSGGFTFFTEQVKAQIGFDHTHANLLEIVDDVLTGCVIDPILDKDSKQEFLESYQATLSISKEQILAVGDGANDIPMLQAAGLGIAYHAKEHVKAIVPTAIDHTDLSALLFIQGYRREEFIDA